LSVYDYVITERFWVLLIFFTCGIHWLYNNTIATDLSQSICLKDTLTPAT